MSEFKDQWNLEMALEVLGNKTVDSKLWSEAVKWLLLYGPPQVREILQSASSNAISEHFPELKSDRYNEDGEPCYDMESLAKALGVESQELVEKMAKMEDELGERQIFDESETRKVQ